MILVRLLEDLGIKNVSGNLNTDIKGIAYDSRLVEKDFIFVAVRGFMSDGHHYIEDAINRGATAIVAESTLRKKGLESSASEQPTAFIQVSDSRESLALLSDTFYGHPSKQLSLIGITGTNGKTTTSFIVKSIIESGGRRTGLLGTVCYMTGDKMFAAVNTTPESLDLQRYLSEMVYNKMEYAILEVSSHALELKRVAGCSFRVAAFTNFSQDHLDFHGTMDAYFRSKENLFDYIGEGGIAVLNVDDPVIRPLEKKLNRDVITCGTEYGAMIRAGNIREHGVKDKSRSSGDIMPRGRSVLPSGLSFDVETPKGTFEVSSSLIGRFNVNNILISIGIAYALGISVDVIQRGIETAKPVLGRFEKIDEGQDFLAVIDYAHTADALQKIIEALRAITSGKLITVFGCGGDRDRTKRPIMGKVASGLSDFVVITSDNPRSEDPEGIIMDIIKGMKEDNYMVQVDRGKAIREAVSIAKGNDSLLVAGKGHEDYQEIKGERLHFSDKEMLRMAIREKLKINGQNGLLR